MNMNLKATGLEDAAAALAGLRRLRLKPRPRWPAGPDQVGFESPWQTLSGRGRLGWGGAASWPCTDPVDGPRVGGGGGEVKLWRLLRVQQRSWLTTWTSRSTMSYKIGFDVQSVKAGS